MEDTLLYSKHFFADRASLLSVDLGIEEKYKPIIEKHIKFFAKKERTQRFYDLEIEDFNEENILTGILSAICHTRTCSFEEVVRVMLTEGSLEENRFLADFAEFSNLGLAMIPISDDYPEKYDRLLCGGIWCIVQLEYEVEGDFSFGIISSEGELLKSRQKKQKDISPISIRKLTPVQMPHIDIEELKAGRKAFTKNEWMDILMRSIGMEPDALSYREKWLLLTRMVPLVENNFNLCELGPRSTGKSHLYKEISPNSILVSGGQTTVANLFYNMSYRKQSLRFR